LYDIIIVGLGPAGATLARLLSKEYTVAVIDKKRSDEKGFRKPCGGLLAMDAQKSISRFGLTLPKEVLVDPQIFAVRTIDMDIGVTRHYQRFYINLDRHKFDQWLKSLIPKNVTIFDNCLCTRIEKQEDCYNVEFLQEGNKQVISAKYIVGADGANSIVRRYLYPNKKIRSYVSIQQWFTEKNHNPFYSCIFILKTRIAIRGQSQRMDILSLGRISKQGCRARFEDQKKRLEKSVVQLIRAII